MSRYLIVVVAAKPLHYKYAELDIKGEFVQLGDRANGMSSWVSARWFAIPFVLSVLFFVLVCKTSLVDQL